MFSKRKKGFTLVELIVVIAVLGVLAAILIPIIGGYIAKANTAADKANARCLFNAVAVLVADEVVPAGATYSVVQLSPLIDLSGPDTTWHYELAADGLSVSLASVNTQAYHSDGSFTKVDDTP